MKLIRGSLILAALLIVGQNAALAQSEARLLRFPDVHGDRVVFVYAGDIWIAGVGDGLARRLTSGKGLELFPRFSPDGRWIAFSAEYDGNREVYVMPSVGGEPRRLTWRPDMAGNPAERMGFDNMVIGWTPDSRKILFRSRLEAISAYDGKLYTVDLEGGLPERLPVPRGGFASFSPDGNRIAYNRVFREFRTWKRYRGGQVDDVWLFDLRNGRLENVTGSPGQDTIPMWRGDRIYFVSDRDHTANIFVYDLRSRRTRKLTTHDEYDVKYPSAGPDSLVYENGGYIYLLDFAAETPRKLTIQVHDDRVNTRPEIVSVANRINWIGLSPEGNRALFVARGDVFTVPAQQGNIRNLTNNSATREKTAVWSPDGAWIAYVSDATGEDEIYVVPHDGSGPPRQVTRDGKAFRFAPVWSRDGKKLLCADQTPSLYYVDVETGQTTQIDTSTHGEITMYSWSPDGKWVAFARQGENALNSIFLYSLDQGRVIRVTDGFTNDWAPVFDPDGKYLYFLSNRDFNPTFTAFELNFSYSSMTRPYAITLRANAPSPFAPKSDEAVVREEQPAEATPPRTPEPFQIDLDGIGNRAVGLPIPPGNYAGLNAARGKVFYVQIVPGGPSTLKMFDLNARRESEVVQANGYVLSASGEKLIYVRGQTYGIIEARPGPRPGDITLNLGEMKARVDRREEWVQIFNEAWRMQRDYFYAPNMHGVDWEKMRERYARLLPFVSHRFDLTYVIGEMIAELNASHAYVGGGDMPSVDPVPVGLLGADLELDRTSGRYRIRRILEGQNWTSDKRSPLTEPGIDVRQGDYIISIDGVDLRAPVNPYSLLENTVGKTVTLRVSASANGDSAREARVRPMANETGLRYYNWVEANRRHVEEKTGGRVGYVHIPDMSPAGLNEFVKYYYPQIRKEALIVDVRFNGGGFVSQTIIERLRRVLTGMSAPRNWSVNTYPSSVFVGPMVCVTNEFAGSDGDIFPYQFRVNNLGRLIGKRTWGGVVGIRGNVPLKDGGYITRPEFANFSADGEWVMEGEGVAPDIEVDNLPFDEFNGKDAQLDRAIEEVMKELREYRRRIPSRPADPVKK